MSYLYVIVLMIEFEKRRFMKKYMAIKKARYDSQERSNNEKRQSI